MSTNQDKYGKNRNAVTINSGSKGEKPGEEGARKIDEFVAGSNKYNITDLRNADRSTRKQFIESYEELYKGYKMDYEEYCYSVKMAGGKPKAEEKLKRAPIGTQPAHIRAEYIQSVEDRFTNGTFEYTEYKEKVLAAGGTPKSEEEFDRQ